MAHKTACLASLSLLSLMTWAAPAQAQTPAPACSGPMISMARLEMTPLPGSARVTVPVSINGTTQNLLLATGAGSISLTAAAGKALGLHESYDADQTLLDFDGYASHHYFRVKNFTVGSFGGQDVILRDTPNPHAGVNPHYDGMLAADLLYAFDVEMDFVGRRLTLFSPDHCPGQVIHWSAEAVGEAPITLVDRGKDAEPSQLHGQGRVMTTAITGMSILSPIIGVDVRTTVMLDGKPFTANIDTGAEISTLNTDTASAAFDVTAETPGSVAAVPLTGPLTGPQIGDEPAQKPAGASPALETVIVYGEKGDFQHSFHTLSFGGVTVKNPLFLVRPDRTGSHDTSNNNQTGSRLKQVDDFSRPQITIGMNVLRQLHLYFAFKEGKLYATAAAPSVN